MERPLWLLQKHHPAPHPTATWSARPSPRKTTSTWCGRPWPSFQVSLLCDLAETKPVVVWSKTCCCLKQNLLLFCAAPLWSVAPASHACVCSRRSLSICGMNRAENRQIHKSVNNSAFPSCDVSYWVCEHANVVDPVSGAEEERRSRQAKICGDCASLFCDADLTYMRLSQAFS